MNSYIDNLSNTMKEYFKILSADFPDFLYDYIDTTEMKRLSGISVSCGTIYSKLFDDKFWYSTLDHSIGVALIVWNFTKDRKQTLAGLFHDIATPVFKHSIDFMNGDYETQESTEELTMKIISESREIMSLLNRDGIKVEEVSDYHIYPIADNDSPKLAADRLEYTFSNALGAEIKLWEVEEIREIYSSIEILINEEGIEELGFRDIKMAEKFVHIMSKLSERYIMNKTKFSMQFLADIMKKMFEKNLITLEDLYTLSEKEIINMIENCNYSNISTCFDIWKNSTMINESDEIVEDMYCVGISNAKIRYIKPLIKEGEKYIRIDKLSNRAKQDIEKCLNYRTRNYAYLDFKF